jgi:hypothetical protein
VAVLGCGIDRDYPAAHAELARRIVDSGGLIVSEYEPGIEPAPWASRRGIASLQGSRQRPSSLRHGSGAGR